MNKNRKIYQTRNVTKIQAKIQEKKQTKTKTKTKSQTQIKTKIQETNININPNVIKNHKYIPNLEKSISNFRKTINIKNLKIEIPINTYEKKKIFNNILK
jgi:hypothetical protein